MRLTVCLPQHRAVAYLCLVRFKTQGIPLLNILSTAITVFCISGPLLPTYSHASDNEKDSIEAIVAQAVRPLMEYKGIPGMAVGIVSNGQSYVFNYGTASRATGERVNDNTLF